MLTFYGKVVSLSPITHGAVDINLDDRTNKGEIRRLPFVVEGDVGAYTVFVPVVSGNSIKGLTRRSFTQKLREALGAETFDRLPNEVKYLIAAGGASTNASPALVKQEIYAELRRKLPFISLLGGIYMGHYFRSLLIVNFMVPLVKEIIPLYLHVLDRAGFETDIEKYPSLADLHSNEYIGYTRFKAEGIDSGEEGEEREEDDIKEQRQMIYYTKLIPPGTKMIHSFSVNSAANEVEQACFYAFLKTFIETGTVGGSVSKGHGRIKCEYRTEDGKLLDIETLTELEKVFWDYINKNKDDILHELMNLDQKLQWTTKGKKVGAE